MYKVRARQSPSNNRHVTLSISVGGLNHEGEKFAETMRWATKRFDSITVCVSDSFQRYKLQSNGLGALEAHSKALRDGVAWVERNLNNLTIDKPISVTRWDMWRRHPDFADVEDTFAELAITNEELAKTVDKDANYFLSRNPHLKSGPQAFELCRAAVIEELAVHTLQAREYGGSRVYPGDQIESLGLVRSGGVPSAPFGLQQEQFIRINLERRAMYKHVRDIASKAA